MNFFKLYVGDYQRDTGALSIAEHGAYFLMLQYHYATEKPLPTGKELYRLLRCESKADRAAVDAVVKLYWSETDGGLVNGRSSIEIAKASEQAETNRRIAQAREDARKAQRTQHEPLHEPCSDREPSHSHNQTPEQEVQNLKSKSKVPRHPVSKEKTVELPDWLPLEQWQAYLEMRQRIRKPATHYAQNMAIAKLSELREQGQHPAAVLGQAIMNSWQAIYPLKNEARA